MADSSDSVRPTISLAYPRSETVHDLHTAAVASARAHEHAVATFKSHTSRIKVIEAWKDGTGSRPGMEDRMDKLENQTAVERAVGKRTLALLFGVATVVWTLINAGLMLWTGHH